MNMNSHSISNIFNTIDGFSGLCPEGEALITPVGATVIGKGEAIPCTLRYVRKNRAFLLVTAV